MELLEFPQAIDAVIDGKKITRQVWADQNIFGHIKDGVLKIRMSDGQDHEWILTDGDMFAVDWKVVESK